MEIKGFKGFKDGNLNRYGKPFQEGESYHIDGPISFGNNGNGFHMCTHLSDVFRYFDPEEVVVAEVTGSGECVLEDLEDWSEPYYDMYAVSDIRIDKFLSRKEIIDRMCDASSSDVKKFFATYNPTEDEAIRILRGNRGRLEHDKALAAFLYYIKGVNVYEMKFEDRVKVLKKVLDNGQDSNQRSEGE